MRIRRSRTPALKWNDESHGLSPLKSYAPVRAEVQVERVVDMRFAEIEPRGDETFASYSNKVYTGGGAEHTGNPPLAMRAARTLMMEVAGK
jgi:hypothetical protein